MSTRNWGSALLAGLVLICLLTSTVVAQTVAATTDAYILARLGIIAGDLGDRGLVVREVAVGGPAGKAGVRRGDIILTANRKAMASQESLAEVLRQENAKSRVRLTIRRGDDVTTVAVLLRAYDPDRIAGVPPKGQEELLMLGMALVEDAERIAVVRKVGATTPAAKAGIKVGDAIVAIETLKPTTFAELREGAEELLSGEERHRLRVTVLRKAKPLELMVELPTSPKRKSPSSKSEVSSPTTLAATLLLPQQSGSRTLYTRIGRLKVGVEADAALLALEATGLPQGRYTLAVLQHGQLQVSTDPVTLVTPPRILVDEFVVTDSTSIAFSRKAPGDWLGKLCGRTVVVYGPLVGEGELRPVASVGVLGVAAPSVPVAP